MARCAAQALLADSMIKIVTVAHLPDELQGAWLQHLRDFDTRYPGCHFEVVADARDALAADVLEMLDSVKPGFALKTFIKK